MFTDEELQWDAIQDPNEVTAPAPWDEVRQSGDRVVSAGNVQRGDRVRYTQDVTRTMRTVTVDSLDHEYVILDLGGGAWTRLERHTTVSVADPERRLELLAHAQDRVRDTNAVGDDARAERDALIRGAIADDITTANVAARLDLSFTAVAKIRDRV